jgi:hypothetical protein
MSCCMSSVVHRPFRFKQVSDLIFQSIVFCDYLGFDTLPLVQEPDSLVANRRVLGICTTIAAPRYAIPRPCRPYSMNVSIQFWTSLCLRSYSLAASTMVFWPLMISKTKSALRRAVHLSIAGSLSPFLSRTRPLSSNYTAYRAMFALS